MTKAMQFARGAAVPAQPEGPPYFRVDFAWEFLRRNTTYRQIAQRWFECGHRDESAAWPWGLQFLADPTLTAPEAEVFWRIDAAPSHVIRFEALREDDPFLQDLRSSVRSVRRSQDGIHLRFTCGLQGLLEAEDLSRPLAAILPIGGRFADTLRGLNALERQLSGKQPLSDLTPAQGVRLARVLSALDAADACSSYRDIADGLFGQEAIDRHVWRTSSVRDGVRRLVRTGRDLTNGGYRKLLLGAEPET